MPEMCPDDNTADDLVRRGDAIDVIKRIADDHEDLVLCGESEQARIREGMASALRRAQYAVAFMPSAGTTPHGTTPQPTSFSMPPSTTTPYDHPPQSQESR